MSEEFELFVNAVEDMMNLQKAYFALRRNGGTNAELLQKAKAAERAVLELIKLYKSDQASLFEVQP
jgi:hypothetical protein